LAARSADQCCSLCLSTYFLTLTGKDNQHLGDMKIQKLKEEFVLKYTANLMEKTLFPHYEIQVCIHTSEKTQV